MTDEKLIIKVDLERACSKCGRKEATQCGLCLKCMANNIRRVIPMGREYSESERIKLVAAKLIEEHHPHLKSARIAYLMKERSSDADAKPTKELREGKTRKIASARLVTKLYQVLTPYDFVIEVDEVLWDLLTLDQQDAAMDHELCHCVRDVDGWYIRDHDVQEFRAVLERHGFWQPKLEEFVCAAPSQRELPFAKPAVNQ